MSTAKLIKKILKDKGFLNEYRELMIENYVEYLEDYAPDLKPAAKVKTNFVGIEIECFTHYYRNRLMEKIVSLDLHDMVQADGDGSIQADFGEDLELRVLLPEKKLASGLKKLNKLFVPGQFGVNNSCGLHIHLDMRNRDVNACYKKLMKFQDVLFSMVEPGRRNSEYCAYNHFGNENQRYVAINKSAYRRHKTIEIRLHHATLDMKLIEKWVNLLLRIIGPGTAPTIECKDDVLKWARKQPNFRVLAPYIAQNCDETFFKKHEKKDLVLEDRYRVLGEPLWLD